MNEVVLIMMAGIVIGWFLRQKKKVFPYIDKTITVTIFLLLFFLGLSVGLNDEIVKNFHLIGFNASLLTAGALAGSILLSWGIYHLFFKRQQSEK